MYYEKFMNNVCTSSGWASDKDLATSRGCLKGNWHDRPKEGGVVLYNHSGEVVVDGGDDCRHVLVIGATGTGKSRLIILPSLLYSLQARTKRSFIVFDVKGELEEATTRTATKYGYRVQKIDFRSPDRSDGWNPFFRANMLHRSANEKARAEALKLLENIIASIFNDGGAARVDPFWRNSSSDLFRGICAVLWGLGKEISLQAVLRLSDSIPEDKDDDDQCRLFMLVDKLASSSPAKRLLAGFRSGSNQTRGNVLACYRGYLSPVVSRDDVLKMVSAETSVDFQTIGLQPTVLYITLPDDSIALGPLQGILLTQLVQELNECALQHGLRLPVPTEVYLDELCNIRPAIPSLESALTIGRSRGIRYILAIQSYSQLLGVYDRAAETIAANCSTWISLNIAKDETFRNKLSQLCGCNAMGDPLITPSQLSLLRYEQAIVIRERCAPYFSQLEDVGKISAHSSRFRGRSPAPGRLSV